VCFLDIGRNRYERPSLNGNPSSGEKAPVQLNQPPALLVLVRGAENAQIVFGIK
jgi:hypothetical protein